jgi:hypothetical protein
MPMMCLVRIAVARLSSSLVVAIALLAWAA